MRRRCNVLYMVITAITTTNAATTRTRIIGVIYAVSILIKIPTYHIEENVCRRGAATLIPTQTFGPALGALGVGRRDHARMLLLAAVAGENALLFGPPGTAKSLLARRLKDCFADEVRYFECLLTKFSMPEEVFGPVSLKGLEQDIFRRVYDRYMPGAGVAFIDETFKANSAILNSMLTILNEREFDTGNERIKVPLRCVVGASNEMPKESELEALYDRFIIRMRVDRLQDEEQLARFLTNTAEYVAPEASLRLTKAELEAESNYVDLFRLGSCLSQNDPPNSESELSSPTEWDWI